MDFFLFSQNDARRIWRLLLQLGITMLAWALLHPHVPPECHEDLHYALFGFLHLYVPRRVSRHKLLHSDFEQG
jgi:hypothetical protein